MSQFHYLNLKIITFFIRYFKLIEILNFFSSMISNKQYGFLNFILLHTQYLCCQKYRKCGNSG